MSQAAAIEPIVVASPPEAAAIECSPTDLWSDEGKCSGWPDSTMRPNRGPKFAPLQVGTVLTVSGKLGVFKPEPPRSSIYRQYLGAMSDRTPIILRVRFQLPPKRPYSPRDLLYFPPYYTGQ